MAFLKKVIIFLRKTGILISILNKPRRMTGPSRLNQAVSGTIFACVRRRILKVQNYGLHRS